MLNVISKKKKREQARYTWGLRRNLRQILLVLCTDNGELHTIISQTLWRRNENEWMLYCRCCCPFYWNMYGRVQFCSILYITQFLYIFSWLAWDVKRNFTAYLRLSVFSVVWVIKQTKFSCCFVLFLDLLFWH